MLDTSIKVGHIADLHLKFRNREHASQTQLLDNVVSIVEEKGFDVFVIAGDIFDITPQNEFEQSVAYTFMLNLLKIPTLKELVVIDGNHDIIKTKELRTQEDKKTATETFLDMINNSNVQLSKKLIVGFDTALYKSKHFDNLQYLCYSWKDNFSTGHIDFNSEDFATHTTIGVFHDMIQDFVVEKQLPVREDILANKFATESFQMHRCDMVIAGDIHENWNKNGFYYCGSLQQCNYGEGVYISVDNLLQITDKNAIQTNFNTHQKYINSYLVDLQAKSHQMLSPIEVPLYKQHFTVEFNNVSQSHTQVIAQNTHIGRDIFNLVQECIQSEGFSFRVKIKWDYLFAYKENEVKMQLQELFKNTYANCVVDIEFSYKNSVIAQRVKEITLADTISEEQTDEDTQTSSDIVEDFISGQVTTNDIILSNEQLEKMFVAKLEMLVSSVKGVEDAQTLTKDIITIFKKEFDNIVKYSNNKQYTIKLKRFVTNNFMKLGKNDIDLDIPALTRIKGTNGIGKTTLYTAIKYMIEGVGFDGLKKNANLKNNCLLFNYSLPEQDEQVCELYFSVNGVDVKLTRTNTRIWKPSAEKDPSLKISMGWIDYVQTIKSTARLEYEQIVIDNMDEVAAQLREWFRNLLETITIINDIKLSNLLNSDPTELKNIILYYLGVDFLDNLKATTESVKDNLEIVKPKTVKGELTGLLDTCVQNMEQTQHNVQEVEDAILLQKQALTQKENEYTQALALLDPNCESYKSQIQQLQAEIMRYEGVLQGDYGLKELQSLPQIENYDIKDDFQLQNEYLQATTQIKEQIQELSLVMMEHIKAHTQAINEQIRQNDIHIQEFKDEISRYNSEQNAFRLTKSGEITSIDGTRKLIAERVNEFEKDISEGVCPTCKRAFDVESHKEHTKELMRKINLLKEKDVSLLQDIANKQQQIKENETLYKEKIEQVTQKSVPFVQKSNTLREQLNNIEGVVREQYPDLQRDKEQLETRLNELSQQYQQLKVQNDQHQQKYKSDCLLVEASNKKTQEHNQAVGKFFENKEMLTQNENLLTANAEQLERVHTLKSEIASIKSEFDSLEARLNTYKEQQHHNKNVHDNLCKELTLHKEFDKKNLIVKLYKKMVDSEFPYMIFVYYQKYLNKILNELLDDINFKLYWHTTGELFMVSVEDGVVVYKPVLLPSGMETTFLGLSLVYAIHKMNIKNNLSHIFIDEISGKLNSGKDLEQTQKIVDYQQQLVNLLTKFSDKSVFIVDHVIDNLFETHSYEVIYDKAGNKFV